jgi:hydroxysqualene synthase
MVKAEAPAAVADAGYAACARFARRHYENFPVASRLLPAAMRPHVAAVYAFARVADDFADEGAMPPESRLSLLDGWLDYLRRAAAGRELHAPAEGYPPESALIFGAVGSTIRACDLPVALFEDLLSAFRQDVTTMRYRAWDDVLDYCRRSANPVGRLVLRIAGYRDADLDAASDAVCTALQLTNFWQDLARDWANGRLYLPLEDCRRERAEFTDLDAGRITPEWRRVLSGAAARPARLFELGRPVCDGVRGRLGLELRVTWLGGRRILERVEQVGFDVFEHRPTLSASDVPVLSWRALTWRRPRRL